MPLDAARGLGAGSVSPGLTRVVARATREPSLTQAVEQGQEARGAQVSEETARRVAEHLGAVAAAQTQAAVARAQTGRPVWSAAEGPEAPVPAPTTLAVEVAGVLVHRDDGWHDMKVVTVAPLGPQLHTERATGRTHLRWGRASYGVGAEGAEEFWWRVYVEALRRGLGPPAVRTVVVVGAGAEWIWHRAKHFLGVNGVEGVEIVDIYHAYEDRWAVGNALYGAGSPCAAAWVEPLKDQLYAPGAEPVLRALAALTPPTAAAREAVADAQSSFTTQATRMDYPRFVARQFPLGWGAVESACQCVVDARLKQAGRRWATAGSQASARRRALHRSGRWTAFWPTQPHAQSVAGPPASASQRAASPAPARPATPVASASRLAPAGPSVAAAPVQMASSAPHAQPNPTRRQRPLILPRSA